METTMYELQARNYLTKIIGLSEFDAIKFCHSNRDLLNEVLTYNQYVASRGGQFRCVWKELGMA